MTGVTDRKNISRLLCEKNDLFRHGLLWPIIKKTTNLRLPMSHNKVLLAYLPGHIAYKRGNKAPDSPVYR